MGGTTGAERAGSVLRWRSEPLEPARILELVSSPVTLAEAIREAMPPGDRTAQRCLTELDEPSATIREGFQTFVERLGSLLDSPAGRSLGTGPEAVRLDEIHQTGDEADADAHRGQDQQRRVGDPEQFAIFQRE